MKKVSLIESINNSVILLRNGVPIPVLLFALKSDGLSHDKAMIVIRWAQNRLKNQG